LPEKGKVSIEVIMRKTTMMFIFIIACAAFAAPRQEIGLVLTPVGSSLHKTLSDSDLVPVEFEFHHELSANDSGVGMNGSYNNWGDVFKCRETAENIWTRVIPLSPGNYQYKFVTYTDTVGQKGVTGWFTDALNPDYGGPYRDSYMVVSDPMVYYLTPLPKAEIANSRPVFSAKISHSVRRPLDLTALEFVIDGIPVENAGQYYNPVTRYFIYTPKEIMPWGSHTVLLRVKTMDGKTAERSADFSLVRGVVEAPLFLQFDSRSPYINVLNTPSKATVEWLDLPLSHPLSDPDGDGLFTREVTWKPNVPHQYRVVVDEQIYLEYDPNNPLLSETYRSVLIKSVTSKPWFQFISPRAGSVFAPGSAVTVQAMAMPSDSAYAFSAASIRAFVDGVPANVQTGNGDRVPVQIKLENLSIGRHVVTLAGADIFGNAASTGRLAIGVYAANSGRHYIDAEGDDKGFGSAAYPPGVKKGAADIQAVYIAGNATLDSLKFTVDMAALAAETRLGFLISNGLNSNLVAAPENLDVKIPEWVGKGIYATIAMPTALGLRPLVDNILFKDFASAQSLAKLSVHTGLPNQLTFAIAIADLESVLGTFNRKWYFTLYSFLCSASKSVELDATLGGIAEEDEPDVYDLAFCNSDQVQAGLLSNYILSYKLGGPRSAAMGSEFRGAWGLAPADIHADLAGKPDLRIRTAGGDWYSDSIKVAGTVSDAALAAVDVHINSRLEKWNVVNKRFEGWVVLLRGVNKIYASSGNLRSEVVTINYKLDISPEVFIETAVNNGAVTLDGRNSRNPLGQAMRYKWTQDATNPESVILQPDNSAEVSFATPKKPGEYYFTLTVTIGSSTSGWGRAVILVDATGAHTANLDTWHPAWVDTTRAYEIYSRTFSPTGKFSIIKSRLAELKELGINVIFLRPIHPSTAIHGYWITDYYGINPDYGTEEDFRSLVSEAHKNNIRVIMDYVVNHTVDVHPFMRDALSYGVDSPYHDFYRWNPDATFHYYYTWVNLPSINFESVSTRAYLIRMARYWVQKFNVDGFRCDVAHRIEKDRVSGPLFWKEWRKGLKAMKPDIWLLAEADANDLAYYDRKFDSAYDYWWASALRAMNSGVGSASAMHQVEQFYQTAPFPDYGRPKRYLEDFDGARYLSQLPVEQVKIAAAVLLASPGVPMLYAGQEAGELTDRGLINWSDPNQLRQYYKKLLWLRQRYPELSTGWYRPVTCEQSQVYAYSRGQSILVVANFGKETEAELVLPTALLPADANKTVYLLDLITGTATPVRAGDLARLKLNLPATSVYILQLSDKPTAVGQEMRGPLQFQLEQNFPNPFNPTTVFSFVIGGDQPVRACLYIYNAVGQQVRRLLNTAKSPGAYAASWDGRDDGGLPLGSGLYFYRLSAGPFSQTKKMLLIR
jgi:cyclomaltodextrinase / maltogenic alpha-amylase / neopullulanase